MDRVSTRVSITGKLGSLSAIIDAPKETPPKAWGVFSHCFSCTKDLKAIVKISRKLAANGYAVFRFDFAGLGNSEGDFSETDFHDNLEDVRSVVNTMTHEYQSPKFLMGHSLGGSAMMAIANEFASVEAVSVIASPSDTTHLANTIRRLNPAVEETGEGMVNTGLYEYLIKKKTVDTLRSFDLPDRIKKLSQRILVFHSPADQTLGLDHAQAILANSGGPASLINLESANHLLTDHPGDCELIGSVLSSWLDRYLSESC